MRTRGAIHTYALQRLTRAQHLLTVENASVARKEARGEGAWNAQSAADLVNRQWADIKASARTPLARMRAMDVLQPDGSRARTTEGCVILQGMLDHGKRQQGPSPAHIAFSRAIVDAFCPEWPELDGLRGGEWTFRNELPFDEFRYALGRMADKACGNDGLQIGFLRMLPSELLWQFWDLLITCAEHGTFPEAWAAVTAVLIPKKAGLSLRIEELRDIWLQCVGPKVLMKMVVGNVFLEFSTYEN